MGYSMKPIAYGALPAYLGGKRRLVGPILGLLAGVLPRSAWRGARLLDPMSGGGAFALGAKAAGFDVTASDLALRAVIPARALVANSSRRLSRADVGLLHHATGEAPDTSIDDAPDVFLPEHRGWFLAALAYAAEHDGPLRSLIELLVIKLILRTQPMSMLDATDASAAVRGDFDRISPRRLGHYLKARELLRPSTVWSVAEQINAGVFPGCGRALRGDACTVIAETEAEILYLDPPYPGTTTYATSYRALDRLLGDDLVETSSPPDLDALLDAARHIPLVVISLGGPRISCEGLAEAVERHRPVLLATRVAYTHLPSLRKESAHAQRFDESLVIAGRR